MLGVLEAGPGPFDVTKEWARVPGSPLLPHVVCPRPDLFRKWYTVAQTSSKRTPFFQSHWIKLINMEKELTSASCFIVEFIPIAPSCGRKKNRQIFFPPSLGISPRRTNSSHLSFSFLSLISSLAHNTFQTMYSKERPVLLIYLQPNLLSLVFPGGCSGKEPACQCRRLWRSRFDTWVGKIPWRRAWQPTPVFLPGESHGQRSLVGHSPWGRKESNTTEPLRTRASFLTKRTNVCWLYSWVLDRSLLLFERL